ncbi:MAG: FAD binding domain-containing protein [Anaerolineae bacterium]|nr:FAD binding domain-containing protein [Anaerolineae bacterium]
MNRFAYATASSLAEVLDALDASCRPLAGGTDLIGLMKEGLIEPESLINLKTIPGLDGIEHKQDGLHVGALALQFKVIAALEGKTGYACLYQALVRTATPQLRHMATVGGNLLQRPRCWYFRNKLTHCLRKGGQSCFAFRGENKYHAILGGGPCYIVHPSDMAVALLALDAAVVIAGADGARTVSLGDFFLLPKADAHREVALADNELLVEIVVPAPAKGARGAYLKVSERQSWDFSLVSAAVQVDVADGIVKQARVALGGVAPIPWRAGEAEAILAGKPLSDETIDLAARAATSGARPLAQNEYKIDLARGAVKQALQASRA